MSFVSSASLRPVARLVAVALAAALASAGAATAGPDLIGRWATPTGGVVEFGACASPRRAQLPCGRIAALGEPAGGERLDAKNPSVGLRSRHVLGLEIISGLRPAAGFWAVDTLYNPDDGRTYSGAIRLRGEDGLELKGCALRVFCQTQVWSRVP